MVKILDFWAPWCGQCKAFAPVIDEVVKETGVELEKVDASTDTELCDKYGVQNLPTLVLLKDGAEAGRVCGFVSKENLLDKVKELL